MLYGLTLYRHHIGDLLARFFDDTIVARKALFYCAAGVVGSVLYAIIWKLTPWKPAEIRVAVALVCSWGMLEESETTICRVSLGLGHPPPALPMGTGLCDALTNIPITTMQLVLPTVIVYYLTNVWVATWRQN